MLGLQEKEADQESRKHMWMGRHRATLHPVVGTEIPEMCAVSINTCHYRYKIGAGGG